MSPIKYSAWVLLVVLLGQFSRSTILSQEIEPSVAVLYQQRDTKSVPDFQRHVVPVLGRLGCNSAKCHGSFQGQGGFRLSLFGFDFRSDHQAIIGDATSEEGKRSTPGWPDQSLILKKATEQIDHEGGKRMELGSWEYHLLARWIKSGAKGAKVETIESPPSPGETKFAVDEKKFFREKIQPILVDHCYECHGYTNPKSGLSLNRRDRLIEGGSRGKALVVGNPAKSLLMEAVLHTGDLKMPPSGKLKKSQIEDLEQWIQMGVPWSDSLDEVAGETQQKLVQLHFEPEQILFHGPAVPMQVRLIAEWENGLREDVTCLARFQTNNDAVVLVNRDGLVRSVGPGDSHIVAFYDNGVAAIPVIRPYESQVGPKVSPDAGSLQSDHPIDRLIHSKLEKLNLIPSRICSDSEFLRRVSIDLTGTLPTPEEIRKFLDDGSAKKRLKKVDELLTRSTYAAWWSNKLCDFTGCNPKSISSLLEVAIEEGYVKASLWYDWIFERVNQNVPYDQLVKGIMLAEIRSGVGEDSMPYFWTRQSLKESKDTAMSVAHAFLGIQLQCAECHKHPFDQWTQADFRDFSKFFDTVTYGKQNSNAQNNSQLRLLRSGRVQINRGDDTRQPVFDWMTAKENPWFA
ncbi:MAG: DUF1549 domain-containing protein, partial [Planctomycetota bacterium]|nr:DUF1549 domain-containing protein [Planctomycetota bacterium]